MKTLIPLKRAAVILGTLLAVSAATPPVRPQRSNPAASPVDTIQVNLAASGELAAVLDRACGECHSNQTSSRPHSKFSPVAFMIARGAKEGRKAVNFSEWSAYSPEQQRAHLIASCTDAQTGKMPMSAYLRFRPEAKLTTRDVEIICGAAR